MGGDEEVKLIKIFWLVVPLPDELLVKDLLDQKAEPELYVRLPHAADVTVNVSNQSGEAFVPHQTFLLSQTFFGGKNCIPIDGGETKTFTIPRMGKFAISRRKVDGSYIADFFEVEDDWTIEINIDATNYGFSVSRVLEYNNKRKLVPLETRNFSMEENDYLRYLEVAAPW